MLYDAPRKMLFILEKEYMSKGDPELVKNMITIQSHDYFKLRIGRAIVFALAKKSSKEWTPESVTRATSPESLSMAADDFMSEIGNIRKVMNTKFKQVA